MTVIVSINIFCHLGRLKLPPSSRDCRHRLLFILVTFRDVKFSLQIEFVMYQLVSNNNFKLSKHVSNINVNLNSH